MHSGSFCHTQHSCDHTCMLLWSPDSCWHWLLHHYRFILCMYGSNIMMETIQFGSNFDPICSSARFESHESPHFTATCRSTKQLFIRRYRFAITLCWFRVVANSWNSKLLTLFPRAIVVNLTSSIERVCPGDTVVFTCITDTGNLFWHISKSEKQLYQSGQVFQVAHRDIFTLRIVSETGSVLISTATAHNVSLDYDGKSINCSDSAVNSADTIQQTKAIKISISIILL